MRKNVNMQVVLALLGRSERDSDDGVTVDSIIRYARSGGISQDEAEDALMGASQLVCFLLRGDLVHLTETGFVAPSRANDNLTASDTSLDRSQRDY